MRYLIGAGWCVVALAIVLLRLGATGAVPDTTADRVFGQPSATDIACNFGGLTAASLCAPQGVAVDAAGNVYIADTGNNRVLQYDNPFLFDAVADGVIGQAGFAGGVCNAGGVSAASLCEPAGVDVDGDGNLYVADRANNRVLQYDRPLEHDTVADRVFGQPDFTTTSCNTGGISASSLCGPESVSADDAAGNVFIADTDNNRVVGYLVPLTIGDTTADRVFGQPGYTTNLCNNGGTSATSLCGPMAANFHGFQHLFVADTSNHRVVLYDNPVSNSVADFVMGQPTFASSGCNSGGVGADTLCLPSGVAIDEAMNTYVADSLNRRIVRYDDPMTFDSIADGVYGQGGSFSSTDCYLGGPTLSSMCSPAGLAVDFAGNFFSADVAANRVLEFDACASDVDCDAVPDVSDNCPLAPNPAQDNNDRNFIDQSPPYASAVDDRTRAMSDPWGDACDDDDDNDGRLDGEEVAGGGCGSGATNPLDPDTDGDRFVDGPECVLGSDPASAASRPIFAACGPAGDSDGDRISDRVEFCLYGTLANNIDSDGDAALDGGKDGCEIASLNGDRIVNSIDQGLLAAGQSGTVAYHENVDINKDGVLNSIDQGLQASFIVPPGQCP